MTKTWTKLPTETEHRNKLCFPAMAIVLALFAQAQSYPAAVPVTTQLNSTVVMDAGAETVQLKGDITVQASFVRGQDGAGTVSYSCSIAGMGTGLDTEANYFLSGSGSGLAPVSVGLPADIGLNCPLSIVKEEKVQRFRISLQGTLDAEGNLATIVTREIAANPEL